MHTCLWSVHSLPFPDRSLPAAASCCRIGGSPSRSLSQQWRIAVPGIVYFCGKLSSVKCCNKWLDVPISIFFLFSFRILPDYSGTSRCEPNSSRWDAILVHNSAGWVHWGLVLLSSSTTVLGEYIEVWCCSAVRSTCRHCALHNEVCAISLLFLTMTSLHTSSLWHLIVSWNKLK